MKKTLLLTTMLASTCLFAQGQEDFNTGTLTGWTISNQSAPVGTTTWQQPDSGNVFTAHEGTDTQFFFANFNSTGDNGTICNYLIMPTDTLGDLSFWSRSTIAQDGVTIYADRMTVRYSPSGGTNTGNCGVTSYGDFSQELVTINPNLESVDYPTGYPVMAWTNFNVTIPGDGRVAFIYHVTAAGAQGTNSNYIGLDTVSWSGAAEVPIFKNSFE